MKTSCLEKAEKIRKDGILANGKKKMEIHILSAKETAIELFTAISGWKEADELIVRCRENIAKIEAVEEAKRLERERKEELARIEEERLDKARKRVTWIMAGVACAVIIFVFI